MNNATLVLVAGLSLLAGCDNTPAPVPAAPSSRTTPSVPVPVPAPTASPTAPAASGEAIEALGLKFVVPSGWKSAPPSNNMRLAEIQVPGASGDAAKACTIVFSTAGGTVQSNMDRWAGQVTGVSGGPAKSDVTSRDVAGLKVSIGEFTGTFAGMGDSPAKQDWMLRGAIIEAPGGLLFVKMTGPAESMTAAGPAFHAMIDGLSKP